MKKLSFFLMAMLFSVMSFAQTVLFTQTYPGNPSVWTSAYTKSFNLTTDGYKLTYTNINNGQQKDAWTAIRSGSKNGASVATILSEQIAKPVAKVAINFTQVTANKTNALYLEVAATDDFASATKIEADIATGTVEFAIAAPAANQYYRVTIDQAQGSANGFNRWDKVIFYEGEAASGDVETVSAPEFSEANANFSAAFTLNITSEEGTTLKYTLDNTDPATSATAIEVAANTASVEITKSTAVKAIAIKGELVSVVKSKVYCYVNTKETAYTVAEAMAVIDAGLGLDNELFVKGTISKIESFSSQYGSITYWIEDEASNQFECYSGLGLNKAKFTAIEDIEVGAYVVACGVMKKYNTIYEFNYNNYMVEYVAPVVNHTVTVTANAEGENVVSGGGEYEEGEKVTVTASEDLEGWVFIGWTEDGEFVANDPEYTFVVKGDVELVAVYAMDLGENEVTDLVIDGDNMLLTGSVAGFPMGTMNLELALGEYDDEEGVFLLTEESKLYVGETNFTFVDGMAAVDMSTNSAMAIVVFELDEAYYYMTVNMSAAPAEPIEVNVTNATATVGNDGWLTLNGTWNELPVMAKVAGYDEEAEEKVYEATQVGEFEYGVWGETEWDFGFADQVTVTKKGDVITLEATFTSLNSGNVYNVTITTGAKISTAVDNVEATVAPVKTIENGQLIVIKNGVKYNALGQEIK